MFSNQDALLTWIRQAARLWLFLDYDGTLAEFSDTPGIVKQNPAVIHSLSRLIHEKRDLRIAIISGRRLEDIQELIPFDQVFLAGTYGIDIRLADHEVISRGDFEQLRPILDKLKPRWETMIRNERGFYLEDKGWSLALHARFASDLSAQKILDAARQMAMKQQSIGAFRLFAGDKFFEVAPINAHKGKTVAFFLERFPWQDFRLIYCGDDDKDEEAFRVVHDQGGITIWVSHSGRNDHPPLADFVMDSPRAMRQFLDRI